MPPPTLGQGERPTGLEPGANVTRAVYKRVKAKD